MTVSAVRLNHAVLFVADLERSLDFYKAAFDMEVVAREPRANAAFLRLPRSGNHHDLGLFGVGGVDALGRTVAGVAGEGAELGQGQSRRLQVLDGVDLPGQVVEPQRAARSTA